MEKPYYIDEDLQHEDDTWPLHDLHERYHKRCTQVHEGRTRNVFDMGKYVVKIPRNSDGIVDNDWEGSVSDGDDPNPNDVQLARTRLAYWKGIPVVFMEKVSYPSDDEIKQRLGFLPDWTASVDCGQVGFNAKGRLVAYDYGLR